MATQVITGYTFDADTQLKDAGAITASAAAQVGGAAKVVDVGDAVVRGDIVIDVTAMDIVSNDELYDIVLQGSPDAAFGTAGNIHELAAISLSAKAVKRTDSDKDDVIGRYLLPFVNVAYETSFRYLRLYTIVAGTTPSINYKAFIGTSKAGV